MRNIKSAGQKKQASSIMGLITNSRPYDIIKCYISNHQVLWYIHTSWNSFPDPRSLSATSSVIAWFVDLEPCRP